MPKKQIIQVSIIVIAFGAAAVVLYNGFFKNSNNAVLQQVIPGAEAQGKQGVLPYGNTLDFSILKKQNFQFNQVNYPMLDSGSEVGIPEESLITIPSQPGSR